MQKNPLSNMSYTNKDFNSIYVELLDLAKKLSYKWDPTISNESDPGNVLIKLDAIIGDKNNYNIDKNILERFPETLSQEFSARSLYKQLAYNMPWYRSAITKVTFKWKGNDEYTLESDLDSAILPRFQMISDESTQFVYTTLEEAIFNKFNTEASVKAIEGILTELSINGSSIIELSHLDSNHRIYFEDSNIAENGIFITNINGSPFDYWSAVDNIYAVSPNSKVYEFGVDARTNQCYVEFPQDIMDVIGEGLSIKYILTNGSQGNIAPRTLDRFYQTPQFSYNGQAEGDLPDDVISVLNFSAANTGSDPETIEDAYKHYMKTAGTFHTLVTLRDYINAIYNSGLVSNVVVSDRLTDIQSSYTIIADELYSKYPITEVIANDTGTMFTTFTVGEDEKTPGALYYVKQTDAFGTVTYMSVDPDKYEEGMELFKAESRYTPDMSAFDLKIYALQSIGANTSMQYTVGDYNKSFKMVKSSSNTIDQIKAYINNEQSIQHDFVDILPDRVCLFRNEYPIQMRIIPQFQLNALMTGEVSSNINKALLNLLNSRNVEFGEMPDYDTVYAAIINADERIKTLILEDFTYTTKAVWWDSKEQSFMSADINQKIISPVTDSITYTNETTDEVSKSIHVQYSNLLRDAQEDIIVKSVLAGVTPLYIKDSNMQFNVTQDKLLYAKAEKISTNLELKITTPEDAGYVPFNSVVESWTATFPAGSSSQTEVTGMDYETFIRNIREKNFLFTGIFPTVTLKPEYASKVVTHILGNVAFLFDDFAYGSGGINDLIEYICKNAGPYENISTANWPSLYARYIDSLEKFFTMYVKLGDGTTIQTTPLSDLDFTYILRDNESIRALAPTLDAVKTYSSSVRYLGNINSVISANTSYQLKSDDDWIVFLWRESSDEYAPYKYEKYTSGSIIKPSFTIRSVSLPINTNQTDGLNYTISIKDFPNTTGEIPYGTAAFSLIYNMYDMQNLSGTAKIDIEVPTEVSFSATSGRWYYFISNTTNATNDKFVMKFNKIAAGKYAYTLGDDETFFHVSPNKSAVEAVGSGTYIEISIPGSVADTYTLEVTAITPESFEDYGADAFLDLVISIPHGITIRQQQIYNFIEGNHFRLKFNTTVKASTDGGTESFFIYASNNEQCKAYYALGQYMYSHIDAGTNRGELKSASYWKFKSEEKFKFISSSINSKDYQEIDTSVYTISYSTDGGKSFTDLSSLDIEGFRWAISANYNINCSYDKPQVINANTDVATTTLYIPADVETGITFPASAGNDKYNYYMLTNILLTKAGGFNIDVSTLTSSGLSPTHFYVYREKVSLINGVTYNSDGSIDIDTNVPVGSLKLNDSLEVSKDFQFILPIKLEYLGDAGTKVKVTLKDDTEVLSSITFISTLTNQGVYYYRLYNDTEEATKKFNHLTLSIDGTADGRIRIGNLYKYVTNTSITTDKGIDELDILSKINQLGKDKFNFIATYNENEVILDPLKPESFFESIHIYNKYVIAKAILDFPTDLKDDSGSYIKIINNR